MNALTVCVDFHDYLAITLPRNERFFDSTTVITEQFDLYTRAVVQDSCRATMHYSSAFRRRGCSFNKGLAISEVLMEPAWWCILDADIVLHPNFADAIENLEPGSIYMPKCRRQCDDPLTMVEYADQPALWDNLPEIPEMRMETHGRDGGAGYCQIFHTSDPVLATRPWYPTGWPDAGGCDTEFLEKWPPEKRVRLDCEVLHLGKEDTHWCGRVGTFLDGSKVPDSDQHAKAMQRRSGAKGLSP